MHVVGDERFWEPFPPAQHLNEITDRKDANRAIAVSALGLALTGLVELLIAVLSGSVGLLGDAIHNLSDVSTSLVVFVGLRISKRSATPTHPYGWDRAEDIAGLGVALVIWMSAAFTAVVSIHKLLTHGTTTHLGYGVAAAFAGIVGNQLVARYKFRVGRRIQSATLIADARHSWLDALSSAGALVGIVGVASGWHWADAVAGLLLTGFIGRVGYEVTRDLLHHLMDGVEPGVLVAAVDAASKVPGVAHAHARTRWMGRSLVVEIIGFVEPGITIHDSDAIGDRVESAVRAAVPEARTVLWSATSHSSRP
jgi:cation diffusion facilitator family transporter